ncbi:MAG TPA: ROK family transcriptional regulator [Nocardioides sp.]|nr:ROK family transcriptional regulator [Nocardioides sp.]
MAANEGASAVGQSSLRETNLATVLAAVCRAGEPPSRADLAVQLAMTRATAARLVDELVEGGLLDEIDPVVSRRGRPARLLLPGRNVAALGLVADTDRVAARVVSLRGTVLSGADHSVDLVGLGVDAGLDLVRVAAAEAFEGAGDARVVGAALAVPGVVADGRTLVRAPNLSWSDLDLVKAVGSLGTVGQLLEVGNEADLAAMTVVEEAPGRLGAWPDFLFVSGTRGVGGAIVSRGRVVLGEHGGAGEIGHVCVDPDGPECPCGSRGCLEQYAGRDVLARNAGVRAEDVASIGERAAGGDQRCTDALADLVRALSVALASVVNIVGISSVVLGGHLGRLEPALREELHARLDARVLGARWAPVRVRAADDSPASPAVGAAHRVLGRVLERPAAWL